MFYVIKRLDLAQSPVYLNIPNYNSKPINVTRLDAATPYSSVEAVINAILLQERYAPCSIGGRLTVVRVEEVTQPVYKEVAL